MRGPLTTALHATLTTPITLGPGGSAESCTGQPSACVHMMSNEIHRHHWSLWCRLGLAQVLVESDCKSGQKAINSHVAD